MSQVLKINGQEREFPEGDMPGTLSELLVRLDINEATVVAEIDGQIVQRKDFGGFEIKVGSNIELVRFVGGG